MIPKTNSGNNTYDGIGLGGERVTHEIETYLNELQQAGKTVKKLSVVGYSLGGLVARYAVGILYSRGWFAKIEAVNFTTFASPHLGVRTSNSRPQDHLWNWLGSHTLSVSGEQLFLTDDFQGTGRPLLSVLADPSSIFMKALSKFKNRALYANIINDRSAPYYTTSFCTTDPFTDLDDLELNYLDGYAPNILDPAQPVTLKSPEDKPSFMERLRISSSAAISNAPFTGLFTLLLPIASTVFLANAGIQAIRSQQRIKLHEEGKAGIGTNLYRIPLPLLLENAKSAVDDAVESLDPRRRRPTLQGTLSKEGEKRQSYKRTFSGGVTDSKYFQGTLKQVAFGSSLNLNADQLAMVKSLDEVGFRKYRVHIQQSRHSHASIIVRIPSRKAFDEGRNVIRHWLDEEFEL